jgi:hypothetical protein
MALVLDGNGPITGLSSLTFPSNAGTVTGLANAAIPATKIGTGAVLQVVQALLPTQVTTTTNNTFVTTGLLASITPTSSSSKILATVSGTGYTSASAVQGIWTLYRNSTNLSTYGFTLVYASGANPQAGITFSYLDSPATTSSTTYTLYFTLSNSAGTVTFNSPSAYGQGTATIILQEIAG